jgi:hypothetical protein
VIKQKLINEPGNRLFGGSSKDVIGEASIGISDLDE